MAIKRIRDKGLKELFEHGTTSRINPAYHETILDILDHLDAATGPRIAGACVVSIR